SFGGNREGGSGEHKPFNRDSDSRPFNKDRGDFKPRREGGDRDFKPFNKDRGDFKPRREGGDRDFKPRREGGDRDFKPREHRDGDRSVSTFRKDSARSGGYTTHDRNSDIKRPRVGRSDSSTDYQKKNFEEENTLDPNEPFAEQPLLNREIRLNRFVAMSGVCSRREADELIQSGDIAINGTVITEFGTKVKPGDIVTYKGEELRGEKHVYIVMNKPKGVVTTVEDPNAEKTIIDLLENQVKERVFPVGRLDKNSLGVILLTNDGDLTRELTHPSFEKKKIYHVFLDKNVKDEDMESLANGFELEDGFAFSDEVSYVNDSKKEVGIEIHSGRNRIVRRMFEHLGYQVNKLDRVYFAGLTKKGLKRGFWRYLTPREVSMLKGGSYK
ncbi:MAG: pseudouridine synthase, partial [Rikenellaceae bacterium]